MSTNQINKIGDYLTQEQYPALSKLVSEGKTMTVCDEITKPEFLSAAIQDENWFALQHIWSVVSGPFTGKEYQAVLQKLSLKEDNQSQNSFWDIVDLFVRSGRNEAAAQAVKMVQTSFVSSDQYNLSLRKVATFALVLKQSGNFNQALLDLIEVANNNPDTTEETELSRLDFFNVLASIYITLGYNNLAKEVLTSSLLSVQKPFESNEYCTSLCLLGIAESNSGNLESAKRYIKDSLDRRCFLLGEFHPDTLSSKNALANLYFLLGKTQLAVQFLESIVDAQRATLGEHHSHTLSSYNNLGGYYLSQGHLNVAKKHYLKALKGTRSNYGKEHLFTIQTYLNLNNLLLAFGKVSSAKALSKAILKSPLHRNESVMAKYNLAQCLLAENEPKEALSYARQAYRERVSIYGKSHLDTLHNLLFIADLYDLIKRPAKAEALYKQGLRRSKLRFDEPQMIQLKFMTNLAVCLMEEQKLEESVPLLRESLKLKTKSFGYSHIETFLSLQNMAHYYSLTSHYKAKRFLSLVSNIISRKEPQGYLFQEQLIELINSYD